MAVKIINVNFLGKGNKRFESIIYCKSCFGLWYPKPSHMVTCQSHSTIQATDTELHVLIRDVYSFSQCRATSNYTGPFENLQTLCRPQTDV